MNWLGWVLIWIAGGVLWYGGYRFGLTIGHMRGHRCEALMQRIYEAMPDKEEGQTHDTWS